MLSHKLLICSRCKSDNISAYQIIQTRKQIVIWYRCIDCGRKDRLSLDISEKKYLLDGMSIIFFRCYRCGSPIIIQELRNSGKVSIIRYQCIDKRKTGKKVITSILYHDLRTKYLSRNNIRKQETIISLKEDKKNKIKCPECNNLIYIDSNFCSYCGANLKERKLDSLICPKCGKKVKPDANFCTKCGAPLKKIKAEPEEILEPDDPFINHIECHFCGANVPDENRCSACGAKLRCDCGSVFKPGAKYCYSCGRKVPLPIEEENEEKNYLICPGCSEKVPIGYSFCTNCGFNMENIDIEGEGRNNYNEGQKMNKEDA
ncbi:MAG: double zinc ribbon domain-containing protein [Candidatus Helarchaeota archaeon]